jgi:hypothetical protein
MDKRKRPRPSEAPASKRTKLSLSSSDDESSPRNAETASRDNDKDQSSDLENRKHKDSHHHKQSLPVREIIIPDVPKEKHVVSTHHRAHTEAIETTSSHAHASSSSACSHPKKESVRAPPEVSHPISPSARVGVKTGKGAAALEGTKSTTLEQKQSAVSLFNSTALPTLILERAREKAFLHTFLTQYERTSSSRIDG